MSSKQPKDDRDIILDILRSYQNGLPIEEIEEAVPFKISRRTLQRRLLGLVNQQLLIRQGAGRASRYVLAAAADVSDRKPVSYNRDFLNGYRPNHQYYLSDSARKHLLEIGKFPENVNIGETYINQIYHRLLVDLTWNSSRLEGNTYSLIETERLLSSGTPAEGKNTFETQMILNHKAAIEFLVACAEQKPFHRHHILNIHALLSDNLLSDSSACGRLRAIPVGIAQSVFVPLAVPQLIQDCFQQIMDTASVIDDPFEQACFMMVQLPYLQPFEDVNKRVSRLSANLPLLHHHLCPLSFIDVSEKHYIDAMLDIYELNNTQTLCDTFVWAYERSCQRYSAIQHSLGEPDQFRLQHRELIAEIIVTIVQHKLSKAQAVQSLKQFAIIHLGISDQRIFMEVVERELMNLHEGNIARYQLSLSDYQGWREKWQ